MPNSDAIFLCLLATHRRLSRRIIDFFVPDKSSSSSSSAAAEKADKSSAAAAPSSDDDEEFIKFAHSFVQKASMQAGDGAAAAPTSVSVSAPAATAASASTATAVTLPGAVVPSGGGVRLPRARSSSIAAGLSRNRRMTFDVAHKSSIASMEAEMNPVERRRQLVTFLSSFLEARVSYDELISTGIIAVDPPPALCSTPVRIDFVAALFDWVLRNGVVEGIFRISGSSQEVDALTDALNKGRLFTSINSSTNKAAKQVVVTGDSDV